jgi:S1/P1 Nuclease
MIRTLLLHVLGCLLLSANSAAWAWGSKGHRIIAAVAEQRLTATTEAQVRQLLQNEDMATASLWADTMRGSLDNPAFWTDYAASWHYVNIPTGSDYAGSPKNPYGDALLAVDTFSAILRDAPLPPGPVQAGLARYFQPFDPHSSEVKRFALRFLLHILADLQQPLHSGYAADRGGNAIEVVWQGKATNLHSLWDSLLLDEKQLDATAYVDRLQSRLSRTSAADINTLEHAEIASWLQESNRLLQRIYVIDYSLRALGPDYAAEFVPMIEALLLKGGLRTAAVLNAIFAGTSAPAR